MVVVELVKKKIEKKEESQTKTKKGRRGG